VYFLHLFFPVPLRDRKGTEIRGKKISTVDLEQIYPAAWTNTSGFLAGNKQI